MTIKKVKPVGFQATLWITNRWANREEFAKEPNRWQWRSVLGYP